MSLARAALPRVSKSVRLGNSGLKVSPVILGCLQFGSKQWMDWILEEKESVEMVKAAWDMGINTFE